MQKNVPQDLKPAFNESIKKTTIENMANFTIGEMLNQRDEARRRGDSWRAWARILLLFVLLESLALHIFSKEIGASTVALRAANDQLAQDIVQFKASNEALTDCLNRPDLSQGFGPAGILGSIALTDPEISAAYKFVMAMRAAKARHQ